MNAKDDRQVAILNPPSHRTSIGLSHPHLLHLSSLPFNLLDFTSPSHNINRTTHNPNLITHNKPIPPFDPSQVVPFLCEALSSPKLSFGCISRVARKTSMTPSLCIACRSITSR